MDFFLVPNDPLKSSILSNNGTLHYIINTFQEKGKGKTTVIHRETCNAEEEVAEIEWGSAWSCSPTMLRSYLFGGVGRSKAVRITASDFLWKKHVGSQTRYFYGDDELLYEWRIDRGIGFVLSNFSTKEEVARYSSILVEDGIFAGEKKYLLRVQPHCDIDYDLIILTLIIMEVKRRKVTGDEAGMVAREEDPIGDGGAEAE